MSGYEGHVAKRQRTDMDPTVYSGQTQGGGGGGGGGGSNFEQETKPNHILLITVLNPAYPITCDVLQKICSGSGQVIRIVIFKKNGVQAMVEFDNIQSAVAAKDKLNGKDIYSGCCTLKIEFAKPDKLNVFKNDDESWDYTNPNLGGGNNMNNMSGTMNQGMAQGMNNMAGGMNQGMGQNMGMSQGMGQNMGMNQGMNQMSGNMGQNMGMGQGMNQMPNTMGQGMTGNMGGMSGGTPMAGMMGGGQMGGPMGGSGPMMPMGGPMGGGPMGGGRGYGMDGSGYGYAGGMAQPMSRGYSGYSTGTGDNYGNGYRQNMNRGYGEPEGDYHDTADEGAPGCVLMIYGLDHDTMNCDRLFNIFCLYGNVSRIKFLKSKEGCAMVQMGDPGGAQRVLSNLNGVEFFGRKMSLGPSKQSALQDVPQPFDLSDGTPSYKEYIGVRNNRFVNADAARKNRIQSPTGVLHYFNAPPDVSEQEIQQVFERADAPIPITVKPFPQKNPDKASSGILEFTNAVAATEALIKCNHSSVKTKGGKFPYTFKLCFSSATRK